LSWFVSLLTQEALHWEEPLRDGYGGYIWGDPQVLRAKWQYKKIVVYSQEGAEIVSDISVWIDKPVGVGGYLFEGNYSSFGSLALDSVSPEDVQPEEIQANALQIVAIDKVYSLASKTLIYYKASLQKNGAYNRT
jgi:hypothetical protein